ncbi:MAG: thioesterase family protein [Synoicihabitans sp.]
MRFNYSRTIHFSDTDAAGVVFFARYLSIAHEAYEEALAEKELPLSQIFTDSGTVIPIAKSEASYLRPLKTGERIEVELLPVRLNKHAFAIDYTLWKTTPQKKRAAVIRTEHVCIDSSSRRKIPLPRAITSWLESG